MAWTTERLRDRLQEFDCTEYAWNRLEGSVLAANRKAAVLIPLVNKAGVLYVWLTLRASTLRNDGGDVAFPGGMKDPDDPDEQSTCLREAHEEIGLDPGQVQILAHLPPTINRRQILISPVVGLVDSGFEPVVNPAEVEAAFLLPLDRFLSRRDHDSYHFANRGKDWVTHVFQDYVGEQLFRTWGLTANMCVSLAIALFQREPDFEWDKTDTNKVSNPYVIQKEYLAQYVKDKTKTNSKL